MIEYKPAPAAEFVDAGDNTGPLGRKDTGLVAPPALAGRTPLPVVPTELSTELTDAKPAAGPDTLCLDVDNDDVWPPLVVKGKDSAAMVDIETRLRFAVAELSTGFTPDNAGGGPGTLGLDGDDDDDSDDVGPPLVAEDSGALGADDSDRGLALVVVAELSEESLGLGASLRLICSCRKISNSSCNLNTAISNNMRSTNTV